jgi:GTP cyclohydrolase I
VRVEKIDGVLTFIRETTDDELGDIMAEVNKDASKVVFDGYYDTDLTMAMRMVCGMLGLVEDEETSLTPIRAAKWFESFARKPDYDGEEQTFLNVSFPSSHQELIWESGLNFVALCPHHLLPYSGTCAIGYIPKMGVLGISKLARALDYWTHYPVKQEDATAELADALMKYIDAQGVMVIMRAQHTCMGLRGVKQVDHQTGTSAVRGLFATDSVLRAEFLSLLQLGVKPL